MSDNRKENDKKNNENDPYDFFKLTTDEKDEKNGSPKKIHISRSGEFC